MGLGKYEVKNQVVQPVVRALKRATGNNPITNTILDTAGMAAPAVGWRSAARAASPLVKPALAAGALILATPRRAGGYDQVTGPNAYYNNPGLKRNQTPRPRIQSRILN